MKGGKKVHYFICPHCFYIRLESVYLIAGSHFIFFPLYRGVCRGDWLWFAFKIHCLLIWIALKKRLSSNRRHNQISFVKRLDDALCCCVVLSWCIVTSLEQSRELCNRFECLILRLGLGSLVFKVCLRLRESKMWLRKYSIKKKSYFLRLHYIYDWISHRQKISFSFCIDSNFMFCFVFLF